MGKKVFITIIDNENRTHTGTVSPFMKGLQISNISNPSISPTDNIIFAFEDETDSWEIPSWAEEKPDHVARALKLSKGISSNGSSSLECEVDFDGRKWQAAYFEVVQYLDFSNHDRISVDIYLPPKCPDNIKAKFILTTGEQWRFIEMSKMLKLKSGKWNLLTADISSNSRDWRRTTIDNNFKSDIRKLAIRLEYSGKSSYKGPIYVDSFRLVPSGNKS